MGDAVQTRPALIVGWHHVPGAFRGVRGCKHGIARPGVIVPARLGLQIHRAELPDLAVIFIALLEALGLLIHVDLQPVLDQDDARADDESLDQRRIFQKVSTCSWVAKPITRSTPARLYQLRSNSTTSPAAGR